MRKKYVCVEIVEVCVEKEKCSENETKPIGLYCECNKHPIFDKLVYNMLILHEFFCLRFNHLVSCNFYPYFELDVNFVVT